ncbi:hypothetical protein LOTGIDRAFT_239634 [Lottia gigantea]|uniref:EF-hand domain-containing protein n=1 Tax=Lottia gigantea TaxID=225164 RepID=V3ZYZ4_LOTGI|nr:hypothetical protein LOTGIDRAFT_239634 [Lottia gigantea]ESO86226.1 hypothetical protein LOTGIDRAFT_239634 [Lottia gigantea]
MSDTILTTKLVVRLFSVWGDEVRRGHVVFKRQGVFYTHNKTSSKSVIWVGMQCVAIFLVAMVIGSQGAAPLHKRLLTLNLDIDAALNAALGDGILTRVELGTALNLDADQLDQILAKVDVNANGQVDVDEVANLKTQLNADGNVGLNLGKRLLNLNLDIDAALNAALGDGILTRVELGTALNLDAGQLDQILAKVDVNANGQIDVDEVANLKTQLNADGNVGLNLGKRLLNLNLDIDAALNAALGDGILTRVELGTALNLDADQLDQLLAKVDVNANGQVDVDEVANLKSQLNADGNVGLNLGKRLLNLNLDIDAALNAALGDGILTRVELGTALNLDADQLDQILAKVDVNANGQVDANELAQLETELNELEKESSGVVNLAARISFWLRHPNQLTRYFLQLWRNTISRVDLNSSVSVSPAQNIAPSSSIVTSSSQMMTSSTDVLMSSSRLPTSSSDLVITSFEPVTSEMMSSTPILSSSAMLSSSTPEMAVAPSSVIETTSVITEVFTVVVTAQGQLGL